MCTTYSPLYVKHKSIFLDEKFMERRRLWGEALLARSNGNEDFSVLMTCESYVRESESYLQGDYT